jgi:hypothetical protein
MVSYFPSCSQKKQSPLQELRAPKINFNRFSKDMRLGKALCAKRASNHPPPADGEAQSAVKPLILERSGFAASFQK